MTTSEGESSDKQSEKSIRFWDRIAEHYAKQQISDQDTYQKKLALTQKYLSPEAIVLEFGCGTGSTALIHGPYVKNILAIDWSQKMIDIANRKLQETDLTNVEFKCATLFDLDHEDGSFDAVLALNVLHLIDNSKTSMQKAYGLLKPGGVFVSSTVCLSGAFRLMKPFLAVGAMLGLIPKVYFMTAAEHERDMADCGFTVVEKLLPAKRTGAVFLIARK